MNAILEFILFITILRNNLHKIVILKYTQWWYDIHVTEWLYGTKNKTLNLHIDT